MFGGEFRSCKGGELYLHRLFECLTTTIHKRGESLCRKKLCLSLQFLFLS